MEFVDGRESRRRDATRSHHHHRSLPSPPSPSLPSPIARHHHHRFSDPSSPESPPPPSRSKLVRKKVVIDKAKNTRGMTLPKLCPSVCKVVVVTREQELVLCRGDVTNLSPSRLTRMLQSLLECQVQPLKVYTAKTLLYTADFKTIVLKYCGSLRKVEETDEP
uniref:Uncharacterized protein n=1 Tax=Brassica oleracea var. oleracea TaxID=109376 RepID=A0A0D3E9Y8_BRAOL